MNNLRDTVDGINEKAWERAMAAPLKPGDLPKPMSRKERQALARIDHAGLAYQRPVEDPDRDTYDACSQSRFCRHSFATRDGVLICTFCRRAETDCRRPR